MGGNEDNTGSNVSSTIMYNIPTASLPALRMDFDKSLGGLSLIVFLNVMVKCMDLKSEEQLLRILPDLIDFFKSVDINGDGKMEWGEFVMFVIESVVVADPSVSEKVFTVEHSLLQTAACRHGVKCTKIIPEFNRMFVGLGPQILIFQPDDHSNTWLDKGVALKLTHRILDDENAEKPLIRQPKDDRMEKSLQCMDFAFLAAKEMLLVLRSDMSLEFHRFMTRTKVAPDLIQQNGFWVFDQPYHRMALRQMQSSARASNRVPWRVFLIGESRSTIDSWTITVGTTGVVTLTEFYVFEKHTDYVTDVMVIDSGFFHYFISCGMDQKVFLYDLATLQHKATRTGFTAGVCCLAFDNRSLLFAGGFDYNIIAWDLDAEIDRPIFQLSGHSSPITKIISIGEMSRAFSLDTSGRVFFWDTSKSNPNDKEARQIDNFTYVDDTLRSFEVFQSVSSNFSTAHQMFLAAQGRRQHVYNIVDLTPKESAPINNGGVLFSYSLLMMVTVHTHDCLFFSSATGDEQKKMDRNMLHLQGLGNEIMSAVLDDRERKLIVGEASGNISVYNMLSGVRLKRTATNIPFAIRDMIYTPDKTIIALAGPGELYIFDELPNEDGKNTTMRYITAHDVDVTCMTYSYELCLIATADCIGCIRVFDFEFLNIVVNLNTLIDTEIGQITFIDKYPLLLVTDSLNNFTIVPVGPAYEAMGRKVWRVNNIPCQDPVSLMHDMTCLEETLEPEVDVEISKSFKDMIVSDGQPSEEVGEGLGEKKASGTPVVDVKVSFSDSKGSLSPAEESPAASRSQSPTTLSANDSSSPANASNPVVLEEEEEEEETGGNRPFKLKQIKEFLRSRRNTKSICVVVQKSSALKEEEAFENHIAEETNESRLLQLLGSREDEDSDGEGSHHSSDGEPEEAPDPRRIELLKTTCISKGFPQKGERVFILCGTDDGHVMVVDLTPTLKEIDVGHVMNHEWVPNRKTYDPRRAAYGSVKEAELNSFTWKPNELALGTSITTGRVSVVWAPHSSAVTTVTMLGVGEHSNRDICTAGADCAVYTWTLNGLPKATLTRGRDWDKLFRPRWKTPIDMAERQHRREKDARILCDTLGLTKYMGVPKSAAQGTRLNRQDLVQLAKSEEMNQPTIRKSKSTETAGTLSGKNTSRQIGTGSSAAAVLATDSSTGKNTLHRSREGSAHGSEKGSTTSSRSAPSSRASRRSGRSSLDDEPDQSRVIGQLRGRITYKLSNKDVAAGALGEKHSKSMSLIASIGKVNPNAMKKKKLGPFDIDTSETVVRTVEGLWLDDVMDGASGLGVQVGMKHGNKKTGSGEAAIATGVNAPSKPRKIKTKYDLELAAIEATDPNNWEINSSNRQRALYGRLYLEMDKIGVVKDPNAIFEHKLNKLAGGNFRSFVARIWEERSISGSEVNRRQGMGIGSQEGSQELNQDSIDQMTFRVNIRNASSLEADSSVVQVEHNATYDVNNDIIMATKLPKVRVTKRSQMQDAGELLEISSVDYQWEQSLRTPLFANPYSKNKDGLPVDASAKVQFLGHANVPLKTLTTGSLSPVKLTPAQQLAVENKELTASLKEEFEKHLAEVDKMSRRAKRLIRRKKAEHRQILKSALELAKQSPVERIRTAILAKISMDQVEIPLQGLTNQPDTRHTLAGIANSKTYNIDDVMDVTRKQKKSEETWRRKLDYALNEIENDDDKKTDKGMATDDSSSVTSSKKKDKDSDEKLHERDKKILARKDFGPYKAVELFRLLRTFQSLPPEDAEESLYEDDLYSARSGDSSANASITSNANNNNVLNNGGGSSTGNNIKATNRFYDDQIDDFDDGDWPTDEEEEEERRKKNEEKKNAIVETPEMIEERERQENEAMKQRFIDMEKAAEAKHAVDVVCTNVRLLALLNKPFIQMTSSFKNELAKVLTKRTDDGTLPRNVLINLSDVLTFCCPYMQEKEKMMCLRYFVLKTPRSIELARATEKGLTKEQLKKLKQMFEFFDKDGSGGIDKFEIVEVLEKLANNKKKEVTSEKLNDDDEKGVALSDAEELIASVQGHGEDELDFDSFIKMFRSLV